MKALKDIWIYVSNAGITEDMESRVTRKVMLTNQITFLACSMTFVQMFMFPTISMFPLLCAASIAAYTLTFWFNSIQWYNFSRLYFCIISCVVIVVTGGLISDEINISFRFMLIQAFVIPMVVFDFRESKLQLVGFLTFVLSYILFDPINASIPLMEGVDVSKFDSPENIVVNGVLCMLVLLLGNRYLQKLNVKAEDELQLTVETANKQREIIEKKNAFIQEGITYAQQIQRAVLPNREDLKINFPDHFVLYKPKELIGGDFYWHGEHEDHILIAAVDCTGHGTPGALISIIGSQLLDKIVKEQGVTDPAEVLELLNLEMLSTLHHNEAYIKDVMDVSLLSIDTKNRTISFAGAKNSLIVLKDNEIQRIRGNRASIGEAHLIAEGFDRHEIELSSNDCLFLCTDGIIDQFGGHKKKKMLYKGLYDILMKNSEYTMEIQHDCLRIGLEQWKGEVEQLDDILMIGMRIDFDHIAQVRSFQRKANSLPSEGYSQAS